jgi:hypothetical protein
MEIRHLRVPAAKGIPQGADHRVEAKIIADTGTAERVSRQRRRHGKQWLLDQHRAAVVLFGKPGKTLDVFRRFIGDNDIVGLAVLPRFGNARINRATAALAAPADDRNLCADTLEHSGMTLADGAIADHERACRH